MVMTSMIDLPSVVVFSCAENEKMRIKETAIKLERQKSKAMVKRRRRYTYHL